MLAKGCWETIDGKVLKIKDMTTKHLGHVLDQYNAAIIRHENKCMNWGDDCGGFSDSFVEKYEELTAEYAKRRDK